MGWKVLITAPYMQPVIDRFRKTFAENDIDIVVPPVSERLNEDELLQFIAEIDGVICGDDQFTGRVLTSAPKLKVLSKWGTGIDSIDQEACKRLKIKICNTPNAFSEPVGDTVLGYILCFARKLPWMDATMKKGVWDKMPGISLRECTLGVIGVGNAGKAVVRRAMAFGLRLLGNDIREMPKDFLAGTGITMVSKQDLLKAADFVSINCDLNPTSFHLISYSEFDLMKPNAVIINTARGPVIDEQALIKALTERKIAGAALDVFEHEPLPADSPLLKMRNVMLAPHNANSSPAAWEKIHHTTINNLIEALNEHKG